MDNLKEIFSENFNRLIDEKGYSQLDVANALNVSPSTVSWWARGKKYPRPEIMPRLADFLNVSLTDLTLPEGKRPDAYVLLSEDERRLIELWRSKVPPEKMAEVRLRIEASLNSLNQEDPSNQKAD